MRAPDPRRMLGVLLAAGLLLGACVPVTRPVVKIGLVAPFEGRYREVGYSVIYAVRLAVREANQSGVAGYAVELMALDDSGEADMAAEQARKLATDPQVLGAVGHWLDETTQAAAPEYAAAGLPLLATTAASALDPAAFRLWPTAEALQAPFHALLATVPALGPPAWGQTPFAATASGAIYLAAPAPMPADTADSAFADRFRALSNGVEPTAYSVLAYDAARLLFDALARDAHAHGTPSRAGVAAALLQSNYIGLSGVFRFDAQRTWAGASSRLYLYQGGKVVRP